MKEIIIRVRDDWDGSTADETLEFRWRDVDYEIDLSAANAEVADKSVDALIKAARVVSPPSPASRKRATANTAASATPTTRALKEQRRAIRAWAASAGIQGVPKRGHLPNAVIDAYAMNHPRERVFPEVYAGFGQSTTRVESVRAQDTANGELMASELLAIPAAPRGPRNRASERASQAKRQRIRQWARENGYPSLPAQGPITRGAADAYFAAHPDERESE